MKDIFHMKPMWDGGIKLSSNRPGHMTKMSPHYILEESIFDFSYFRLYDIDIFKEKWLNCL